MRRTFGGLRLVGSAGHWETEDGEIEISCHAYGGNGENDGWYAVDKHGNIHDASRFGRLRLRDLAKDLAKARAQENEEATP
jgi:hypothetical protein